MAVSFFRHWCAYVAGRRDARPSAKLLRAGDRSKLFPYADGISQHARLLADGITGRYRQEIVAPSERYRRLVARYEVSTGPRLQRLAQEHGEALDKLQEVRELPHDAGSERPAEVVFSHRLYPWVMAALVVLEFPFNLMVMQVLGESLALTAVMAGGISILVPLLGHIIGKQLRIRHYLSALVITTGGVGLLLACAFFRTTYLREAAQVADQRILYAFLAIGIVFLMVSTFASRYSEPGEDERVPRRIVEAKSSVRRKRRSLEEAERDESRLREAIQGAYERGKVVEDMRNISVQREIDEHNILLAAYWRGLQRTWGGSPYPDEAGFRIEDAYQPALWPPQQLEEPRIAFAPLPSTVAVV
jgi:hypothetical protein